MPVSMPLTKRIDANLGYACNNDCLFCYFRARKNLRHNFSTQTAKELFLSIRDLGIEALEITGGEATIREDFLDLVAYAKKELRFKKISVITNGTRFCQEAFARKAIDSGIDDVLVSVHGPDAKLHDQLTNRAGSFDEAIQAIRNVLRLGASCRTNTVINALNYQKIPEIARLLLDLGVRRINYIYFSPLDDAYSTHKELWVTYSQSAPFVREMIDAYKDEFKSISIKVIPFCFLPGYEDYITDFFQNIYDPYEWDFYNRVRLRRGRWSRDLAVFAGLFFFMDVRRILKIGWRKSLYESIMRIQAFRECTKPAVCRECRFNQICPGLWKAYAREFGIKELAAVPGEKVEDFDEVVRKRFSDYGND